MGMYLGVEFNRSDPNGVVVAVKHTRCVANNNNDSVDVRALHRPDVHVLHVKTRVEHD